MTSFPDLIGESKTKELDSLVKPENDTRKPCGKPQGIIKLKNLKCKITLKVFGSATSMFYNDPCVIQVKKLMLK
jgi:hypothetical protein